MITLGHLSLFFAQLGNLRAIINWLPRTPMLPVIRNQSAGSPPPAEVLDKPVPLHASLPPRPAGNFADAGLLDGSLCLAHVCMPSIQPKSGT